VGIFVRISSDLDQIIGWLYHGRMSWCLYLLECSDGSYYAGITNDLESRIRAHNNGTGAKYTRGRTPVQLLASKNYDNRSEASKAENAIKRLPKSLKLGFLRD
jgi:putative endonuclease